MIKRTSMCPKEAKVLTAQNKISSINCQFVFDTIAIVYREKNGNYGWVYLLQFIMINTRPGTKFKLAEKGRLFQKIDFVIMIEKSRQDIHIYFVYDHTIPKA